MGACWVYVRAVQSVCETCAPLLGDIRSSWWYFGGRDRSLKPNSHRSGIIALLSEHRKMIAGSLGRGSPQYCPFEVGISCSWCQHGDFVLPRLHEINMSI